MQVYAVISIDAGERLPESVGQVRKVLDRYLRDFSYDTRLVYTGELKPIVTVKAPPLSGDPDDTSEKEQRINEAVINRLKEICYREGEFTDKLIKNRGEMVHLIEYIEGKREKL